MTSGRPTRSPHRRLGALGSRVAKPRSGIPPAALAYAVPALVAAIAVQTWFRGDAGLATGDLVPPVAPGSEYRAHWNAFDTGAGAPSFQIVSLPYFEGLRLFAWLGLGEIAFQRLWLTALVAGTAAGVVFLARALVRSPLAAAVAGFVPLFSAHRLTVAFDPVPLMAMIAAAVLGGLVIRAGGERGPRPLVFALASLACAFVALNPPHLALVLGWIGVCALLAWGAHGRQAPRRLGRFLLIGAPLALLFNLWWIVPATLTLTGSVFTDRFAAAGVEEWAWTHVRGDLLNVVSFTSTWAWPHLEYFPFSARLERLPFAPLQYVPVVAAALGLILATGRHRRVAVLLAVVGVLAIWVTKGLHDPLPATNRWLYDNAPGFWLLRDPAKTGLLLVLVFALLAALGVSSLVARSRRAAVVVSVLVVGGAAVYAHPLLTGAVAPTERPLLPSAHVQVPAGWEAAATYLESRPGDGKVVLLPRLDYYQSPTTWGYYGASFLHQLIDRPVIEPVPEGYYRDSAADALVARLEARILTGERDVSGLLQALGAGYVVLRHDIDIAFPGRALVAPEILARRLSGMAGLRRLRGFGQADVYEVTALRTPEVYPAVPVVDDEASLSEPPPGMTMPPGAALVPSTQADAVRGIRTGQARAVPPSRQGRRLAIDIDRDAVVVRPFRRTAAETSAPALASLPAPDPPFALLAGSRRFEVRRSARTPQRIAVLSQAAPTQRIEFRPWLADRVGDCHAYDDRSLREVGIAARISGTGEGATLRLAARDHSACVSIPLAAARAGAPVRVRLSYRGVSGNRARVCVWQEGPDRCASMAPLDASPGWHRLDETVRPAADTESVRLFFYADGARGGRRATTRTEYRRLVVATPAPEMGLAVEPLVRLPQVSYRRTGPAEFRVRVQDARDPFVLVAAETFAAGWRIEAAGRDGDDVAHLRVNGYANGWRIPWTGSYELTITYGPERLAQAARRLNLVAVPLGVLALILGSTRRRHQADARR